MAKKPTTVLAASDQTILHFGSEDGGDEYIVIVDGPVSFAEQNAHTLAGFKLLSAFQCQIPGCYTLPIDRPLRPGGR